jgi:MATE family multidrug resistance protein
MAGSGERWFWSEARATLALAWPMVLTNLAQALIQATDVVMLGRAGARALAAATLGANLVNSCVILGSGLMTAASPMIARAVGRRASSVRDVRRTVRQTMWAAVVLVVPLWALLWQAEPILIAFGQDAGLARDAVALVHPMMLGMLPLFWYYVLRGFVAALGRPGWATLVGAVAIVTNAIGDYALIFGHFGVPALGVRGAGISSALSNLLMFAGMAIVVTSHPRLRRYRLFGHWWHADRRRFGEVWRLGTPIALTLGLEVTVFNAAVFLMGLIGTAELAAHAVAIQIAALCFMLPLGLSQAATVRVGLAYGRGDATGVARAGNAAWGVMAATMGCTALMLVLAARPLVGLFLDLGDPAEARVVALAVSYLMVAALFQFVDGAQAVGAGMLRGLHDTTVPMLIAAFGYWVIGFGTAILLAFGLGWGGIGVWTGLAAGLASVALMMTVRWWRRDAIGLVPR